MPSPSEPVPSLGDATALLARSVVAQLRRSSRRARTPARPGVDDVVVAAPPFRRRILWRQALSCVALLLAIMTSTVVVAWWSWQSLQDHRVQLGGERDLRTQRADQPLVDDLVKREDGRLEAPVVKRDSTGGGLDRQTQEVTAPAGRSISVDGRIVATAMTAVTLVAAGAATWFVVGRYRRRGLFAAPVQADAPRHEVERVLGAEPASAPEDALVDAGRDAQEEAVAVAEEQEPGPVTTDAPAQEAPDVAALLVEQRQPEREDTQSPALTSTVTGAVGERLPLDVEDLAPASTSSYDLVADETARERIFDRRIARRVPYVQQGWMWWGEQNAPVTVQDLSLTGLGCLLVGTAGAGTPRGPGAADSVQVFFPVAGSNVKVTARVQWKENTTQGTSIGVEFVDLGADDAELLRRHVVAAE